MPLNDPQLPQTYGNGLFVYDTKIEAFGTVTVSAMHDPELIPMGQGCGLFPFNVGKQLIFIVVPK